MNCTKHDAHVAKLLLAKVGNIPGITPLYHFRSDKGTYRFLFEVEESLEGWAALRTLRTMATFHEPDGTVGGIHISAREWEEHSADSPFLWQLECCPCCGVTPRDLIAVLEDRGFGQTEADLEVVE